MVRKKNTHYDSFKNAVSEAATATTSTVETIANTALGLAAIPATKIGEAINWASDTEVAHWGKILTNYATGILNQVNTTKLSNFYLSEDNDPRLKVFKQDEQQELFTFLGIESSHTLTMDELKNSCDAFATRRQEAFEFKAMKNNPSFETIKQNPLFQDTKNKLKTRDSESVFTDLNTALQKKPVSFDDLHITIKTAKDAIQERHTEDLNTIKTIFQNNSDQSDLQEQLIADLEASHKQSLITFHDTVVSHLEKQHKDAQIERDKLNLLALFYEYSPTMRDRILYEMKKDHEEEHKNDPDSAITITATQGGELKGIKASVLDRIKEGGITTASGSSMTYDSTTGKFSIQMPSRWRFYHHSLENNVKADWLACAHMVKASGSETITSSITHRNEDYCIELLRQAYEANREAGFEEKNMTFVVNGRTIPLFDETNDNDPQNPKKGLFKRNSEVKRLIDERATHLTKTSPEKAEHKRFIEELKKEGTPEKAKDEVSDKNNKATP